MKPLTALLQFFPVALTQIHVNLFWDILDHNQKRNTKSCRFYKTVVTSINAIRHGHHYHADGDSSLQQNCCCKQQFSIDGCWR